MSTPGEKHPYAEDCHCAWCGAMREVADEDLRRHLDALAAESVS